MHEQLGEAHRHGGRTRELLGQFFGGCRHVGCGHGAVHESPFGGGGTADLAVQHEHLLGAGRADETRQALIDLSGGGELLGATPWFQGSIQVRNPYVDPLNLIQIDLLRRRRSLPADATSIKSCRQSICNSIVLAIQEGLILQVPFPFLLHQIKAQRLS